MSVQHILLDLLTWLGVAVVAGMILLIVAAVVAICIALISEALDDRRAKRTLDDAELERWLAELSDDGDVA